jgi:hypothetical protein
VVKKAARLHDVIADNHIDVLAVCESSMKDGATDAIAQDAAPDGYSVYMCRVPVEQEAWPLFTAES